MLFPNIFLFKVMHAPGGPQFLILEKKSINTKGSVPLKVKPKTFCFSHLRSYVHSYAYIYA